MRVSLINGVVWKNYHHLLFLLPVGTTFNIQLSVPITKSTQLLDGKLALELIKDNDIKISVRIPKPVIIIRPEVNTGTSILPRLQSRSLTCIGWTPNPMVSLLLILLKRILLRPPRNLTHRGKLIIDLDISLDLLKTSSNNKLRKLINEIRSQSPFSENLLANERCLLLPRLLL